MFETDNKGILLLLLLHRLQGVPLRVELGPREVKQGQLVLVRRDTGEKSTVTSDGACQTITDMLEKIQSSMFEKYAIYCFNIRIINRL